MYPLLTLALSGPNLSPVGVGLVIVMLIVSLGIHEAAHGWVALKCGDDTAQKLGRITLNPLAHIDPFMTVILPTLLYYTTGFVFGGAKPVPVNFHRLRHPYRDMAFVAFAGPLSNFLIAIFLQLVHKLIVDEFGVWDYAMQGPTILRAAIFFNLLLAAFNLIPIPPLDGSRIMAWLLPDNLRPAYVQLESIGMFLVLILLYSGFLTGPILSALDAMEVVTLQIVSLGGAW